MADAKIFCPPGKDKGYILEGFNQVYTYTRDFNEPFGYLIIFKTCRNDLKFTLANETQSTPYISHNGKTIFLIIIDIYTYEQSASGRGRLRSYEILESDLIQIIEPTPSQTPPNAPES